MRQIDFFEEMIIDNFAGGGGASTGIELATGRAVEHYGMCKEKTKVYHWIFTGWHIDGAWATTYCHGHKRVEDENKEYPDCEHTVTHWMPLSELPKEKIND